MRKVISIAFAAILAFALTMAPYAQAQRKLQGKEVKLGFLNQTTGKFAAYGKEAEIALDMAVEEINAKGGIGGLPLVMIKYDTRSRSEESISMLKKLAQTDNVLAIIGPFTSAEAKAAFPVANQMKIPAVSHASAAPGIAAANRPWAFRNAVTSDKMNDAAWARFTKLHPNVKKMSYIWDISDVVYKSEHDSVFPPLMKKYGIELIQEISFTDQDIDFSAQITSIKAKNPDGVAMSSNYSQGANIVREVRRQGMTQPVFAGIGVTGSEFIKLGGKIVEGVVSAQSFWPDNPEPKVAAFVDKYKKRYGGKPPADYSVSAYDTTFVMKKIIETSGVTNNPADLERDRVKIRDAWANLKGYEGIGGTIAMDKDGDAVKTPYVLIVKDGRWQLLK